MSSLFVLAIVIGAVLAVPYVLYARRRVRARDRVFGIGLAIAAGVYVVFAVARGTGGEIVTELAGLAAFGLLAFLGVRHSPRFLALGWAAHLGWDFFLHSNDASSYAPWWYPALCLGFDLVVAGALVAALWKDRRLRSR